MQNMHADTDQEQPATVTHHDLAKAAGVSVTTIKSYRRKFPGFIPVAGFGKPIRFKAEAVRTCLFIRDCFNQGLSVRETKKRLEEAGFTPDVASVPPPSDAASASEERMNEFLRAAAVMMQSVAKLAEAQKQTDQRLAKMEELITRLAASEAQSRLALARMQPQGGQPAQASETATPPKRVVKVRSSMGTVDSYTIGEPAAPPEHLLDVPVAIRTETGEYLGLPGRLPLRRLAELLPGEGSSPDNPAPRWIRDGVLWRFELTTPDGRGYGLCFEPETTPAGLKLAVMTRLILDGAEASGPQRMDYFRQLKDQYANK